jgi:nucleotide-binding universal stress UspA family protein
VKILLAVDPSDASRKAVEFVGRLFAQGRPSNLSVTLLHVVDSLPDFIAARASDPAFQQVAAEWSSSSRNDGEKLLKYCRGKLEAAGIPGNALSEKLITKDALPEARKVVAVLAVIEEMKSGRYDVVAVGRRGTSSASGAFPGSVAEKILREAQGTTVWVVD